MIINLKPIFSGLKDVINIDEKIEISNDLLKSSNIKKIEDVHFHGQIKKLYDLPLTLTGNLEGVMTLLDDIDLSDVEYKFNVDVDEELEGNDEYEQKIVDDSLDLIDILWQLIQVEVPSKVHGDNVDSDLSGDGWRFIEEEELDKNNVFSNLDKLLERKESE